MVEVTFQPAKGDFGVSKGGGAIMLAVRLGTMSRYGHAAICESVHPSGGVTIIEPMPSGCRRRLARPGEFVWSDVALSEDQRTAVVAYADTTVGLPYDWPAIFRFIGRFWAHRFRSLLVRNAGKRRLTLVAAEPGGESLICSELPTRAYRLVGVDMAPGKPADSVSPGDLRQWLDDRRRAVNRRA